MKMRYNGIPEPEAPVFERRKSGSRTASGLYPYTDQQIATEYPEANAPRRPAGKRTAELSTFNIIVLLVISALVITAYISNVVEVDALMLDYTKLERQESALLQERENLRADINALTSYNRIQKIATEKLQLVHSRQQPYRLEVASQQ